MKKGGGKEEQESRGRWVTKSAWPFGKEMRAKRGWAGRRRKEAAAQKVVKGRYGSRRVVVCSYADHSKSPESCLDGLPKFLVDRGLTF